MGFTNNLLLRRFESLDLVEEQAPANPQTGAGSQGCVVLIEPQKEDREHIAALLKGLHLKVCAAANGEDGLSLIEQHSPDLILSALELPGIDGYMLSQRLREQPETQDIPLMLVVRAGELPDQIIGHESYAHDYIQKPISVPDFKYRVNSLLKLVNRRRNPQPGPESRESEKPASTSGPSAGGSGGMPQSPQDSSKIDPSSRSNEGETRELLGRIRNLLKELINCFLELESRLGDADGGGDLLQREDRTEDSNGEKRGLPPSADSRQDQSPGERLVSPGKAATGTDPLEGLLASSARSHRRQEESGRVLPFIEPLESNSESWSAETIEKYRREYRRKAREGAVFNRIKLSGTFDEIFQRFSGSLAISTDEKAGAEKTSTREEVPSREEEARIGDEEPSVLDRVESEEFFDFPAFGLSELDGPAFVGEENKSPLYNEVKQYVSQTIQLAALEKPLVLDLGRSLVERMIESLAQGSELLVDSLDRRQPFSVSAHSVNVAILALKLAKALEKDHSTRVRIGMAGLLHEIGVVKLPDKLLHKEGSLYQAELQLLRERPLLSSETLRSVDREYGYLSRIVAQILERRNGSGYPLALHEDEIKPESAILAIADFFEAFVHKRPYRPVLTGYQAFRELTADEAQRFGQDLVRGLIEALSLYPHGEIVLLSDGRLAEVVEINPSDLSRPIVRILESGSARECPTLNLAEESIRIDRAVPAENIDGFSGSRT